MHFSLNHVKFMAALNEDEYVVIIYLEVIAARSMVAAWHDNNLTTTHLHANLSRMQAPGWRAIMSCAEKCNEYCLLDSSQVAPCHRVGTVVITALISHH